MYDLQGERGMDQTVGLLHAMVLNNYERLTSIVKGMTQEAIDYKGKSGKSNSIGQLLKHLAYIDLQWAYRIDKEPVPAQLELEYGPARDEHGRLPEKQGVSAEEWMIQYDMVQEIFRKACLALTDGDLFRKIPYEDGETATIKWGIWHVADHNRYHQAHIKLLRREFFEK